MVRMQYAAAWRIKKEFPKPVRVMKYLQLKRKHTDSTELAVEINRIISENRAVLHLRQI